MNTIENTWKRSILRALIVSVTGIIAGFILYKNAIFIPTMIPFQFLRSSITAGIVYAALKSQSPRNVWPMLLVWYALLTGQPALHNPWLFYLTFANVAGITFAIFTYNKIVTRPFAKRLVLRLIFAAAITALVNGLIVITLNLIQFAFYHVHFAIRLAIINLNAQFGAIIGISIGIGIEIAEYLIQKLNQSEEEARAEDLTEQKIS